MALKKSLLKLIYRHFQEMVISRVSVNQMSMIRIILAYNIWSMAKKQQN